MSKILFFPLLDSMPSGHHQVAEALIEYIDEYGDHMECKKIDILTEWNPFIENAVVKIYKSWIQHAPALYGSLYRFMASNSTSSRSHKFHEFLFLRKIEEILAEEEPDLIICSHALPSYLINQLKKKGKCSVPCLNVYTDFFINMIWGLSDIEYHFVPSRQLKDQLITKHNRLENRVFITGIPVSTYIKKNNLDMSDKNERSLLYFAGGLKAKEVADEIKAISEKSNWKLQILSSPDNQLLRKISSQKFPEVQLLPDVASKEKMNAIYSHTTAFVTKPGGTLISEAIKKEIPIFIHMTLPGQEEINLRYLLAQKLVFKISENSNLMEFVKEKVGNSTEMTEYRQHVRDYTDAIELKDSLAIFRAIKAFLNG